MNNRRIFRPRAVSFVLVLVLSILGLAALTGPILVHAAAPALVQTASPGTLVDMANTVLAWGSTTSSGDLLMVHAFCMVGSNPSTVSDSAGDVFTAIGVGGRGLIFYGFAKSGSTTITVSGGGCTFSGSPGGAFSAEEFSGVATVGNNLNNNPNTSTSCSSNCIQTLSISISVNNALIYETLDIYGGGLGSCPSITNGSSSQVTTQTLSCLNGLAGANSVGRTVYAPNRGIGVNSLSMQASAWTQVGHELVELDPPGGTPSNLGTQTACFGNCGNPAVTLANTNSTHTVAFNQSITLFYQFQSQLNGQVLNITTNIAKTYSNGQVLSLGVYTVPVCSQGQPAFTAICPALLQKSVTFTNPLKGRQTATSLSIPVSSGQWVGIALSGLFTGLDVNDTNTQVQMFQTSGTMPPSISTSSTFQSTSLVGLWSYITGNTITGIGPPSTIGGNCSGLLDCIIPNWVFSLCTNQTPACQNASALLWAVMLAIFFSFFIFKGAANILPGIKLPFGEIFMLLLLVWIFIMSGLQLLFVWVPLFFFFVVSLAYGKKTGTFL